LVITCAGQRLYEVVITADPPVGDCAFGYPIGSNVTLTCMITPTPPSVSVFGNFYWQCSTGCAVDMHSEQSIVITNLDIFDSRILNCSATIDDVVYFSEPVVLWATGKL